MTFKDKIAAVALAEAQCQQARDQSVAALATLKAEVRRGATPVRILVSGLALGFASGLTTSGGAASAGGKLLTGPLFSLVMESVLPGLLAGITAAASASAEIDQAAETAVDEAVEEAIVSAEPADEVVPVRPKRQRRKPRRDAAQA